MKTVLALVLAVVVGFVTAYLWLGGKPDSGAAIEQSGDTSQGEKGLKFTPSANNREMSPEVRVVTRTIYSTGTNRLSAQEVLNILLKLNPNGGDRIS